MRRQLCQVTILRTTEAIVMNDTYIDVQRRDAMHCGRMKMLTLASGLIANTVFNFLLKVPQFMPRYHVIIIAYALMALIMDALPQHRFKSVNSGLLPPLARRSVC